jgi:hypothetical protein
MTGTIDKHCACCGKPMKVRLADHKRGWGKYCSKSCKAIRQTQATGNAGPRQFTEGEPRPMSMSELANGGYGHSERDDDFASDKW